MPLVLRINDEKKTVPVCWEDKEATVRIYQRLVTEVKPDDNPVKVFSILTGTDYATIWESNREDLDAAIYQATAFVFNQPQEFKSKPKAKTFRLGSATCLVPDKVSSLTIGQNFFMRTQIAAAVREDRPLESLLSIALAVYLQPIVDAGPFSADRARRLEEDILEMNIYDVYPIAFFLLRRLTSSGPFGMPSWRRLLTLSWIRWPRLPRLKSWIRLATCFLLIATLRPMASCPELSSRNPLTSSFPSCGHGKSATNMTAGSLNVRNE